MSYQFFLKESALFTPKSTPLKRILVASLVNYEEDSLDGDSFVNQSRFDANVIRVSLVLHQAHTLTVIFYI